MAGLALLESFRTRVDDVTRSFLLEMRTEFASVDPNAAGPVDELVRLFDAGGKRLRPVFCVCGFLAGGGDAEDARILPAAGALELLHLMALIHDDVMDGSPTRRGVPSSPAFLTEVSRSRGVADAARLGVAQAVLAGDTAAVFADRLFLRSGFTGPELVTALDVYHRMRSEMAAGQHLDLVAPGSDARRLARLKGGGYTVRGPLEIGAVLAGGGVELRERLTAFGELLGEAFQLLDDLRDGDAGAGVTHVQAQALAVSAREELTTAPIPGDVRELLSELTTMVAAA